MMNDFEKEKQKYEAELMKYRSAAAEKTEQTEDNTLVLPKTTAEQTVAEIIGETETGLMQVRVTALNQAVPIVGAKIVITRPLGESSSVMWSDTTDESGKSGVVELPTPKTSLSLSPQGNNELPYAVYNVRVEAPGFYTVYSVNTQVFPNQLSIVAVDMVPKKETELFTEQDITFTTPPSELLNS